MYGYYIAAKRKRYGNEDLARLARLIWRKFGHRAPSRVDGVSIWQTSTGFLVRLIIRDLFAEAAVGYPPYPKFSVPLVFTRDLT